jgi:hypothetical protein
MFRDIDGAQTGKDIQVVLAKVHAVVLEPGRSVVVVVPAKHPVFLGNPHDSIDAGQAFHVLDLQRRGITDEVDLRQHLTGADLVVNAGADVCQVRQVLHQLPEGIAVLVGIRLQYQDHGAVRPITAE